MESRRRWRAASLPCWPWLCPQGMGSTRSLQVNTYNLCVLGSKTNGLRILIPFLVTGLAPITGQLRVGESQLCYGAYWCKGDWRGFRINARANPKVSLNCPFTGTVCVRVLQTNSTTGCVCLPHTDIHKEIHFKELAHATVKGSWVHVIRQASRLETQERLAVQVQEQSPREPGRAIVTDEV